MIYHETPSGTLHQGEVLDILRTLPDESVNCCVTSPPYWGLRDYGTAEWEGGDPECDHKGDPMRTRAYVNQNCGTGNDVKNSENCQFHRDQCPKCGAVRKDRQLGLERTPEEYVARMVEIFREVRRVLKPDGTLWLNLGDSYNSHSCGNGNVGGIEGKRKNKKDNTANTHRGNVGLKDKDLVGIPWRVAFALQADGWYLRQDIIWHKPNPMPESVTDRCTKAHEYVFLMSKSAKYYYDGDAVKEIANYDGRKDEIMKGSAKYADGFGPTNGKESIAAVGHERWAHKDEEGNRLRNRRSVWTVTTKPFKEAHFATFPRDLIRPMIQAGCPEYVCKECGKPRFPIVKNTEKQHSIGYSSGDYWKTRDFKGDNTVKNKSVKVGLTDCGCNAGFEPGVVMDPFMGSGTTAIEAIYQGKRYIGIDLNSDYCAMAAKRIDAELEQTVIDFT